MKKLAIVLGLIGWSVPALAIYAPNWERPILKAKMEVTHTEFGFQNVEDVVVTLTKRDGEKNATGVTIEYTLPLQADSEETSRIVKQLQIYNIEKDSCGSTMISARLPESKVGEDNRPFHGMGARFNLTLMDHSTRICEDYRPYRWEIYAREGYGWCGTGDSVIEAVGNPSPVITIMNAQSVI